MLPGDEQPNTDKYLHRMDKTIENIKKILHLGGSKPGKKNEKSEKIVSFSPAENGRVNHHTVTASVEVSRDQAERR